MWPESPAAMDEAPVLRTSVLWKRLPWNLFQEAKTALPGRRPEAWLKFRVKLGRLLHWTRSQDNGSQK